MSKLTILQAIRESEQRLELAGIEKENAQYVFLKRKKWNLTDWVVHMNEFIASDDLMQLKRDETKLLKHIPPQYILGKADFLDFEFQVTSDTLIPRVETEELVLRAIELGDDNLPMNVVDIGTGSGAIAISLALLRPQWKMWATDISIGALNVAKENAKTLGAKIFFDLGDVLTPFMEQTRELDDFEQFDFIISNPPYIAKSELADMDESVKQYEPENALFAEDEGLAIYKRIAEQAPFVLKQTGQILLEIGFRQGEVVKEIFERAFPTRKVEILQDMAGKDRMIHVHKIEDFKKEEENGNEETSKD
ncbi:peptide chain release factor N(5)-glutamine methyltransferase [Pilibacter termitis]|uniref:peptide chain release factor N(5)-glutamine methyltransferase n=1 Tax=Pilibacter termitis TaxID=263852 RepID=UPI00389AB8AA